MTTTQHTRRSDSAGARIRAGARRSVALLVAVRVPMQHGIMALALLGGAVFGVLLAGRAQSAATDVLPGWMPAGPWNAAIVAGLLGAVVAGLTAWLVCRPKRAQQWTIEYPRRRTISVQGIN